MNAAAIGDNCIDVYLGSDGQIKNQYPTGNVVDTGVNLQKLGVQTSIISTTGDDDRGKWMIDSLTQEGVDLSHFKQAHGNTAVTYMHLNGKDRVHGDYDEGVLADMVFSQEDIQFAATHDLVHTALWGKAESVLPAIKAAGNSIISFDYADQLNNQIIDSSLSAVDIGFFSYHGSRDKEIESFLQDKVDRAQGLKIAVATFGDKGSLAFDGTAFYQFGIIPTSRIENTVGAGDSFIAGFLAAYLNGKTIDECLRMGASVSSEVIQVFEPWVKDKKEV